MSSNTTTQSVTPRIYVADLSAYNSGVLHGAWIEAAQDPDDIHAEIQAMLAKSPEPIAEDWGLFDYEGFGSVRLSEYEDIAHVAEMADLIVKHGDLAAEVIAHTSTVDEAREMLDEQYQGSFENIEDWAAQYLDDTGALKDMPASLKYYFHYEMFARDCEINGEITSIETSDGQVHVFWAR